MLLEEAIDEVKNDVLMLETLEDGIANVLCSKPDYNEEVSKELEEAMDKLEQTRRKLVEEIEAEKQ